MFSGGSYDDVARWLENFLVAHAKRVDPRAEVEVDAGRDRRPSSYAARLLLGDRAGGAMEFAFADVAENRGSLAWCRALADRVTAAVDALRAPAANQAAGR